MNDKNNLSPGDIIQFSETSNIFPDCLFIVLNPESYDLNVQSLHLVSLISGSCVVFQKPDVIDMDYKIVKKNYTHNSRYIRIIGDGKLGLVKAVKELTGLGLKEAKTYVDNTIQEWVDVNLPTNTLFSCEIDNINFEILEAWKFNSQSNVKIEIL